MDKKLAFFLLCILVFVVLRVYIATENINEISLDDDKQQIKSNYVTGTVVDICGEGESIIEVNKERGGYKKGDKIHIKFERVSVVLNNDINITDISEVYNHIQKGDILTLKFTDGVQQKKGGIDFLEIEEVVKMVYEKME